MPRNSSGSHSWPAAAARPVVSSTSISSVAENALDSDVSSELTSSLDRSGRGGMLAPLRGTDGTVAAPSVSFTNETGTGLFRKGSHNPALSVNGTERQDWDDTGSAINGALIVTGNLEVQGTTGVTLTQGDVVMSEAAGQVVTKSGGTLTLGTSTAHDVVINREGAAALTFGASGPAFAGKPTASATAGGDGATTLTTKGYVDSGQGATAFTGKPTAPATVAGDGATTLATKGYVDTAPSDASASITWGTNWSGATTRLYKQQNGMVTLMIVASLSSGSAGAILTLPAGYRPGVIMYPVGVKGSSFEYFDIGTSGAVSVNTPSTSTTYAVYATFPAAP